MQTRCRALEAWHIRQDPKPMSRDRGILPPVYDSGSQAKQYDDSNVKQHLVQVIALTTVSSKESKLIFQSLPNLYLLLHAMWQVA